MAERQPNAQYNVAKPDSLAVAIAGYQRRFMYDRFLKEMQVDERQTLLDVGVTSDRSYASSNYLEAWYPHKSSITAIGIDDASFLKEEYPGLRFLRASGLLLPFRNCAFDIVHSSAVLEHVGSLENQIMFVSECCRVARNAIFMTTPNRWFPVEFHTILPLVHWLPKPIFRYLMLKFRRGFFAEERNLNLLDARELRGIANRIQDFQFDISSISLCGWPSNLLLIGRRRASYNDLE
ncbi:MAG: class I SAM-dependent methyltransferase [Acidobacteriaceae bacterium]|nr:class I SAM-dependent methyltransferase [Acidobacteriaceae bacterium]MBV9754855.1 class I SAM-dependent methyltransferase [Hyphomicrobiales bacterium]